MKKTVLMLVALIAMSTTAAVAQNFMVVDSEKIFTSIDAYNKAMEDLNAMAERYQRQIDDAFNDLETTFNDFQSRQASMTAAQRQQAQQRIINRENEITAFQQEIFGDEGTVITRRLEVITPIQTRVFQAIERYAQSNGFDMVIDRAANATLLYFKPGIDRTDAIIALVR